MKMKQKPQRIYPLDEDYDDYDDYGIESDEDFDERCYNDYGGYQRQSGGFSGGMKNNARKVTPQKKTTAPPFKQPPIPFQKGSVKTVKSVEPQPKKAAVKRNPVCPLCGEKHNFVYTGMTSLDTRYRQKTYLHKRYQILRCQKCGGKFIIKQPSGETQALVGYFV